MLSNLDGLSGPKLTAIVGLHLVDTIVTDKHLILVLPNGVHVLFEGGSMKKKVMSVD